MKQVASKLQLDCTQATLLDSNLESLLVLMNDQENEMGSDEGCAAMKVVRESESEGCDEGNSKFPVQVLFIFACELCERFSYYGIPAVKSDTALF